MDADGSRDYIPGFIFFRRPEKIERRGGLFTGDAENTCWPDCEKRE